MKKLLLIAVIFYCISCEENNSILDNESDLSVGQLSMSINLLNAPSDVTTVEGILYRTNYDTIKVSFEINNNTATTLVDDLIIGVWKLTINANNDQNEIIYTGTTDVNVIESEITPVNLHLDPVTGGIEVNVTWGNSETNYALSFDGIDDYVKVEYPDSNIHNLNNMLTLESWIYISSFPNIAPRVIDRSDNFHAAPNAKRFILGLYEPDSCAQLNINGFVLRSDKIAIDKWVHIAGTYDGEMLSIYVNGNLSNQLDCITEIVVQESELFIGNCPNVSNRQFDGFIDEVRIWNVVRSQVDIQNNMYNYLSGNESGLISCWRMDENQGQEIEDLTGNNIGILGESIGEDSSDPTWISSSFSLTN